jgi:hypothetical protein
MAWTNSKIFREWLKQAYQVSGTGYTGLDTDVVKVALYDNDITPDQDAALASTGYNTGQWTAAGNEVTDATNWVAGGRALAGKVFDTTVATVFFFDATDLAGGGNVTLTANNGCLVYDESITAGTVAKQGISYHYFGGPQSVTAGTFTIIWHANGINRWTMT